MKYFLIFERSAPERTPGAVQVAGVAAGAGVSRAAAYRTFKPVMMVEVPDDHPDPSDNAFEQAVKLTGRLGEWAAIECEAFIPEMIEVHKRKRGTT